MKRYQPSRTAEYMTYFRALESARPASERLFHDPFAAHFIRRPLLRAAASLARIPDLAWIVERYTDFRLPGARTSAIARTRLIDDCLVDALGAGISQVVILGAGFDCRAYRLAQLHTTALFEVDHPATLAVKLNRLHHALPRLPERVRYVQIDFMREALPDVLAHCGFQSSCPAIFVWEGVTQYLTVDAVDAVLRFVASCAAGTRLLFTYVHRGMLDGSVRFQAATRLLRGFAQLGEPWTFGMVPNQVSEFLHKRGLQLYEDWSAEEYRKRYFGKTAESMKGYEFYHTVLAQTDDSKVNL